MSPRSIPHRAPSATSLTSRQNKCGCCSTRAPRDLRICRSMGPGDKRRDDTCGSGNDTIHRTIGLPRHTPRGHRGTCTAEHHSRHCHRGACPRDPFLTALRRSTSLACGCGSIQAACAIGICRDMGPGDERRDDTCASGKGSNALRTILQQPHTHLCHRGACETAPCVSVPHLALSKPSTEWLPVSVEASFTCHCSN